MGLFRTNIASTLCLHIFTYREEKVYFTTYGKGDLSKNSIIWSGISLAKISMSRLIYYKQSRQKWHFLSPLILCMTRKTKLFDFHLGIMKWRVKYKSAIVAVICWCYCLFLFKKKSRSAVMCSSRGSDCFNSVIQKSFYIFLHLLGFFLFPLLFLPH